MPAGIEMSQHDQVRMIGELICRFANGQPCLCVEKGGTLCSNVKATAMQVWNIAHLQEMTREQWNQRNRFETGADQKKGAKPKPGAR